MARRMTKAETYANHYLQHPRAAYDQLLASLDDMAQRLATANEVLGDRAPAYMKAADEAFRVPESESSEPALLRFLAALLTSRG